MLFPKYFRLGVSMSEFNKSKDWKLSEQIIYGEFLAGSSENSLIGFLFSNRKIFGSIGRALQHVVLGNNNDHNVFR